jgi:hypothetical protein
MALANLATCKAPDQTITPKLQKLYYFQLAGSGTASHLVSATITAAAKLLRAATLLSILVWYQGRTTVCLLDFFEGRMQSSRAWFAASKLYLASFYLPAVAKLTIVRQVGCGWHLKLHDPLITACVTLLFCSTW